MTTQKNNSNAGQYLDELDSLGFIQPSPEWIHSVSAAMMGTVQKKKAAVNKAMLIPVLLIIVVNGLLLFSFDGPLQGKENPRGRILEQMQAELFIQADPVN